MNNGEREKDNEEEKHEEENGATQELTMIKLAEHFDPRIDENETKGWDHPEEMEQAEAHHGEGPVRAEPILGNEEKHHKMIVWRK
jgi:hypothetical protein